MQGVANFAISAGNRAGNVFSCPKWLLNCMCRLSGCATFPGLFECLFVSQSEEEEEEEDDELREANASADKTQDEMQKEETEEESTTLYHNHYIASLFSSCHTPSCCISLCTV